MRYYEKVIDNCLDCEYCETDRICSPDSFDHDEGAYCKKVSNNGKHRLIAVDDWDLRKYTQIPNWCPKLSETDLDKLFDKAGIGSIEEFYEELNGLLKHQENEYVKLIKSLISKGLAYDQTRWEREVAISQLNELGIAFGEDTTKYKAVAKNDSHMKRENVEYTVCNTEWGLDARYVCPECLQPVVKGNNFCPHCGKPLSWYNAPKPTAETRNRLIAYAKNGIKTSIRSTTSNYYQKGKD